MSDPAAPPLDVAGRVTVNDVELAYLAVGDSGPLALCLHGFPDSAQTWRHLMPRLADAGYRAVAPYLRGYAPSGLAADGRYQIGALSLDALALHDALGGDGDAVIIGHDWGALATHGAASHEPARWAKVITMAVPPGPATGEALLTNLAQLKRSWYMFFFQHPLADFLVGANDLAYIDMLWEDWSPGFDAAAELPHVKAALTDPANLAAALGYYRATLGTGYQDPALAEIQAASQLVPPQPTLYLHGANDGCMGVEVAEAARRGAPANLTVEIVEGAGHFLHLEQPGLVNDRVLSFLTDGAG